MDIDRATDYPADVKLSDMASSLRYIPFATDSILLGDYILHVQPLGSQWLVADAAQCVLFDGDGKFVCRIGRSGNGPGEYNGISGVFYDAGSEKIYISPQRSSGLMVYRPDGTFVGQLFPANRFASWVISDDRIFSQVRNITGNASDKLLLLSFGGDTIGRIPNYDFFTLQGAPLSLNDRAIFSVSGRRLLYNQAFNDTVYSITPGSFDPVYVFNISPLHRVDVESRADGRKYAASDRDFIFPWSIVDTERYLFIGMLRNKHTGVQPYYYDKRSGEFAAMGRTDDKGIVNDLDEGMPFFPEFADAVRNEGYMLLSPLAVMNFKERHPGKKLPEILEMLTEDSNPVLMAVTFK